MTQAEMTQAEMTNEITKSVRMIAKCYGLERESVDRALEKSGWIEKIADGRGWQATKKGEKLGLISATYDKKENGASVPYVQIPKNIFTTTAFLNICKAFQSGSKISDKQYETTRKYKANDGHVVSSRGEKIIDDWLYDKKIIHAYDLEAPTKTAKKYRYDFYIPEKNLYIEYWGLDTKEYLANKADKIKAYEAAGLQLLSIEDKHIDNINSYLMDKLKALI